MFGVKNEDPKKVKRLVFWQCRASKLSVKLSGKNKKHCNTYHPYQTYTQTHIQRQRHRHTYSDTQRAPLSVTILAQEVSLANLDFAEAGEQRQVISST